MKICFILISEGWGGAETVVHDLIAHLKLKNIDVSLVINEELSNYLEDLEVEKFNLGSLFHTPSLVKMIFKPEKSQKVDKQNPVPLLNLIFIIIYFWRIKRKLLRFLEGDELSIVHSHLEYADILGYLLKTEKKDKIKWIISLHGHWFSLLQNDFSNPFSGNYFSISFLKKAFKKADRVLFVSDYLQKKFREIIREDIDNGFVIPNGIDVKTINAKLRKTPLHHEKALPRGKFRIFFPGGAKHTKGGDILLKALHMIKDRITPFELNIALEVPESHQIRQLVEEYGLESMVNFTGFLEKDEYLNILSSTDVMAMPSRVESFGLAYLEAMALGIPVIASMNTGAAEIIENHRNGILVHPNPQEVAEALLTFHQDQDLCETISQNNLQDVKKFDWEIIIKLYIEFYEKLYHTKIA